MRKLLLMAALVASVFFVAPAVQASDATYTVSSGNDSGTFGPKGYGGYLDSYEIIFNSTAFDYQLDLSLYGRPPASFDIYDGSTKIAASYYTGGTRITGPTPPNGGYYYSDGVVLEVLAGHSVRVVVTNNSTSPAVFDWFSLSH